MNLLQHFKKKKLKRGRSSFLRTDNDSQAIEIKLSDLQVSETRDFDSLPPTPSGSPMHTRLKKARYPSFEEDVDRTTINPICHEPSTNSFLIMSRCLEKELAKQLLKKKQRRNSTKQMVYKQELSYFAITAAFQRAFREQALRSSASRE